MRRHQLSWRVLGLPVALLLGVGLAAAALVTYTARSSSAGSRQLAQERVALNEMQRKVAQVGQEKLLIERYRDAYANLQHGGAIGTEQRVNWLDALRAANHAVQTLGVDYQLSQQGASPLKIAGDGYQLRQTTMKISIKLLHEEDLLQFLRALNAQHVGLYLLQNCSLSRATSGEFSVRFEPKLSAQCELAWLSLAESKEGAKP